MQSEKRAKAIVGVGVGVLLQLIGLIVFQTGDAVGHFGGIVFGLAGISVFIWGCVNLDEAPRTQFSLQILLIAMLMAIVVYGVSQFGVSSQFRSKSFPSFAIEDQDMVSAADITSRKILKVETDWNSRGGNFHHREIVLVFADGKTYTDRRKYLTRNQYGDFSPTFAPDGQRIAFARTEDSNGDGRVNPDDNGDICLMNVDGTGFRNLTKSPSSQESRPTWSPDGKEIAFTSDRDGYGDVYKVTVATNEVQRMTTNSGWGKNPTWSPDGKLIGFFSADKDGRYISVVPAEGGEVKRLTLTTGNHKFNWTAKGEISFGYQNKWWLVKPDGTNLRKKHFRPKNFRPKKEEKYILQSEYGWWNFFEQDSTAEKG